MRIFGEKIKELRLENKLSLKELSKATGISKSSISRWEKGEVDIKSDELLTLAHFFKVSTDYLLGEKDCKFN